MMNITYMACLLLRDNKNWTNFSFYIKQEDIDTVVDFTETKEEAEQKCHIASAMTGLMFRYYETSQRSISNIRDAAIHAVQVLGPPKDIGAVIGLSGVDMERVPF